MHKQLVSAGGMTARLTSAGGMSSGGEGKAHPSSVFCHGLCRLPHRLCHKGTKSTSIPCKEAAAGKDAGAQIFSVST